MRWKMTLLKPEICDATKGAEKATATRIATILGTKVRVISCTCVSAYTSAIPTPTIMATITAGLEATRTVQMAY